MKTLLAIAVALLSLTVIAQPPGNKSVVIGSMTTKSNALLIVNPPHSDQGVLLPQLSTAQRMSMVPSSPSENGLIVFDTNLNSYFYWSEGMWVKVHAENNAKESFLSIDPIQFQELKADNNVRHTNLVIFESDDSFITASRKGPGEEMIAPVSLPHGALLRELTVHYMDNDVRNLKVYLMRKNLAGNTEQIIAWESSGTSPAVRSESFNNFAGREIINLETYTYRLVVRFDLNVDDTIDEPLEAMQRIYGVRIKYRP
jgi:hypothetical protein